MRAARQVSAFGGEDESDHLDVWEVSWDKGGAAHWLRDKKVRARAKCRPRQLCSCVTLHCKAQLLCQCVCFLTSVHSLTAMARVSLS